MVASSRRSDSRAADRLAHPYKLANPARNELLTELFRPSLLHQPRERPRRPRVGLGSSPSGIDEPPTRPRFAHPLPQPVVVRQKPGGHLALADRDAAGVIGATHHDRFGPLQAELSHAV